MAGGPRVYVWPKGKGRRQVMTTNSYGCACELQCIFWAEPNKIGTFPAARGALLFFILTLGSYTRAHAHDALARMVDASPHPLRTPAEPTHRRGNCVTRLYVPGLKHVPLDPEPASLAPPDAAAAI